MERDKRSANPCLLSQPSTHPLQIQRLQLNKRDFRQNCWPWKWKGNPPKNKASQWRDRKMYIITEHKNPKFQWLHHHTRTLAWNYAQKIKIKNKKGYQGWGVHLQAERRNTAESFERGGLWEEECFISLRQSPVDQASFRLSICQGVALTFWSSSSCF